MFDFQHTSNEQNQPDDSTTLSLEQTGKSEEEQLEAHVAELRHRIEEANYQYYVQDNPLLTDAEYDELLRELQRIEGAVTVVALQVDLTYSG